MRAQTGTPPQADPLLPSKASLRKSPLLPISLVVSVDVLGLTIILPLLPFYAERLGASAAVGGSLISVYAFCQLIAGPLLGRISDQVGRRPLLLVSQAGTFIGFLILAFAGSLWVVFLSRIIDGLTAGNLSLAQAYISDVTRPEERAKSFAIIGIAFGMGFLIGPAISGFLAGFSYQYPIFAAAALSLTSILTTYFLVEDSPRHPRNDERRFTLLDWGNYVRYFRRPGLAPLLLQFWAFAFAFAIFMSGFALYAERRFTWNGHPYGPKEVGYIFAYVGFIGIILQGGFIGRLVKAMGERGLVRAGFVLSAVGLAWMGFTYTLPMLLVVSALAGIGTGAIRPPLTSLITQHADRSEQGAVLGLTQSMMSTAQIIGPMIAGALIQQYWLAAWAVSAAACAAVALLF